MIDAINSNRISADDFKGAKDNAMNTTTERSSQAAAFFCCLILVAIAGDVLAKDTERQAFRPADVHRLQQVGDISISPDGEWVAYAVGTTNVDKDESASDLYMVNWDGSTRIQLTHTGDSSESSPQFSPDGRYLAFIAARSGGESDEADDPKAESQVWILNRAGGEAQRATELAGGVSAFAWSPDSTRLVLVSMDPAEESGKKDDDAPSHDTPKPIVVERYRFKQDRVGYLGNRYERIYVFDLDSKKATLLTPGAYDSDAPAWSPDGKLIAFSSKRQGDPDRHGNSDIYVVAASAGSEPRQLTTWEGPDSSPVFSPDGLSIAYVRSGPAKYADYDPAQIAVVALGGGEPLLLASTLDRDVSSPRWSVNGDSVYFLLTDDRIQSVANMSISDGSVKVVYPTRTHPGVADSFAVGRKGVVATTAFGQRPTEIYKVDDGTALSDHNREFLDSIELATVEGYDAVGKDGVMVGSMLLKPPGFRKGKAYPTIALIHGGPVAQDGYDFDTMAHALAAHGYLVVSPNYRGSSGRGRDFARAIYANWGQLEIQDIHAVMDKLVADGLADPKRLGIGGWSYGGMNTNYAIATDTRFSAAVSGAGIANMLTGYGTDQYITQYENEIGLPWESIDPYVRISYPFYHADRIATPTLFMCGEKDFNVPVINSEQMYQALRSRNVPTQLIIYPGQYHGLSKPSYVEDRLDRMIAWYDRYLGKQ